MIGIFHKMSYICSRNIACTMPEFRESIRIKNVGPLRDIDLSDIRPLTVFIGESASGKSTLMKAIALFRFIFKKAAIRSYLKNAKISRSPFKMQFLTWAKNCGLDTYLKEDSEIVYSVTVDDQVYTISSTAKKLDCNLSIPNEHLTFSKISFIPESRNTIPMWLQNGSKGKADRPLGLYFQDAFQDFLAAVDAVSNMDLEYVGMRFSVQKTAAGKKYMISPHTDSNIQGDPYSVELRHSSSGIQTSTPLSLITKYFSKYFSFEDAFKRSVMEYLFDINRLKLFQPGIELTDLAKFVHIHVEEPELSLYPPAQCALIRSLVSDCFINNSPKWKMSLMLATHSPYIINYLNVLIRASYCRNPNDPRAYIDPENIGVYKIVRGGLSPLKGWSNTSGQVVINTLDLSEPMDEIYQKYVSMDGRPVK